MGGFSGQLWTVIAALTAIALLAMLHCLAAGVRNATYVHDMRVKVARLRRERIERLQNNTNGVEIITVDEASDSKQAA